MAAACNRRAPQPERAESESSAAGARVPPVVAARPASRAAHPRLLFLPDRVERLRATAAAGGPAWKKLERRCGVYSENVKSAGYLGLQWADAIGALTTCWYATGEARYRDQAVAYVRALVHDGQKAGDGAGGDRIVRGNSGYPIRAFGLYAALAYDWLHDAPGMEELRPLIHQRLRAWLDWYAEEGYLNDSATSNYFWGYFATLAIAGLATDGELEDAARWQARTRGLLEGNVIPAFEGALKGGEWGEGWQYGSLVAMEVAMLVDGFHSATGADVAPGFAWLGELVDAHLHRMRPDRRSWYGNGTQHERPAPPDPGGLAAAVLVLERTDPAAAAHARFMLRKMMPPPGNERLWFAVLADDPRGAERDPRDGRVLGYHLPGPGQTFLRSSWRDDAVWVSLQAGARVAIDHQHNDQGHFEIWRGGDELLGDLGGPEAYATINHNSLLIDDAGDVLNYTPNQGVWLTSSRTLRWHDGGAAAVVVGDLADAWAPKCATKGCDERAVVRAVRTLVYLRPDVVITDDAVELGDGGYGATWAAHTAALPTIDGARVSAVVGGSRIDVVSLTPGAVRAVGETESDDKHVYRALLPKGPVWRIEVDSPRGDRERRIRAWMRASNSGAAPPDVAAVRGEGLEGAVGHVGGAERVAVLFAAGVSGGRASLPTGTARALVVGLEPGAAYRAEARGCNLTVARDAKGAQRPDPAGALTVSLSCEADQTRSVIPADPDRRSAGGAR